VHQFGAAEGEVRKRVARRHVHLHVLQSLLEFLLSQVQPGQFLELGGQAGVCAADRDRQFGRMVSQADGLARRRLAGVLALKIRFERERHEAVLLRPRDLHVQDLVKDGLELALGLAVAGVQVGRDPETKVSALMRRVPLGAALARVPARIVSVPAMASVTGERSQKSRGVSPFAVSDSEISCGHSGYSAPLGRQGDLGRNDRPA